MTKLMIEMDDLDSAFDLMHQAAESLYNYVKSVGLRPAAVHASAEAPDWGAFT